MFSIWFGSNWYGEWFADGGAPTDSIHAQLSGTGSISATLSVVQVEQPVTGGGSGARKRAIVMQKKRDSKREIEELVACGAV